MKPKRSILSFIAILLAATACSDPDPDSPDSEAREDKTAAQAGDGEADEISAGKSYRWTTWTKTEKSNPATVEGTIRLDGNEIAVTYEGEVFFAFSGEDDNYWQPDTAYRNPVTATGPDRPDIITLVGEADSPNVIEFGEPVEGLVMAILSLGTHGDPVGYDFDAPFEILSQGDGSWGSGGFLEKQEGDILHGEEGYGMIRFPGRLSRLEFDVISSEEFHGFTVGLPES